MIPIFLMTPREVAVLIAKQAKSKRLEQNLSQQTLAKHSWVSYGTLKKFEYSGQIALASLLKIAITLGCLEELTKLFAARKPEEYRSLDALLNEKIRKRGRK